MNLMAAVGQRKLWWTGDELVSRLLIRGTSLKKALWNTWLYDWYQHMGSGTVCLHSEFFSIVGIAAVVWHFAKHTRSIPASCLVQPSRPSVALRQKVERLKYSAGDSTNRPLLTVGCRKVPLSRCRRSKTPFHQEKLLVPWFAFFPIWLNSVSDLTDATAASMFTSWRAAIVVCLAGRQTWATSVVRCRMLMVGTAVVA